MPRIRLLNLLLLALCMSVPASGKPPANWDGLVQVPSKRADYLYLRPGADFRQYNAILLEPVEVAFQKNWQKEMNRSRSGLSKVSNADVRRTIERAQGKLSAIFEKRFRTTGLQIVTAPAENVMSVFVAVANVAVTAPEIRSAGRAHTFAREAGSGVLVIEVRDSLSGELLGRAVDHDYAGDNMILLRDSGSNWADFEQMFDDWAKISADGFQRLITSSPTWAH
jgi:hypothetical protein